MTASVRSLVAAAIAEVLGDSPANRLDDFGGGPVYGSPLLGTADGDDPVFEVLRLAAGPRHMMPREVLREALPAGPGPSRLSVVAWALPFTAEIRLSNRGREWPSEVYSVAKKMLGQVLVTKQTGPEGRLVRKVLRRMSPR